MKNLLLIVFCVFLCSCNKKECDVSNVATLPDDVLSELLANTPDEVINEEELFRRLSMYADTTFAADKGEELSIVRKSVTNRIGYGYNELIPLPGQSSITMKFTTSYPEVAKAFGIRTNEVAIIEYYQAVKHFNLPANTAIVPQASPYCGKMPKDPKTVWDRGYEGGQPSNNTSRYTMITYIVHPVCNVLGQQYAEHWFPCRLNDIQYNYLEIKY